MKFILRLSVFFAALSWGVAAADSTESKRVGVIVPLTGRLADYGTAIKNGVALAKVDAGANARSCEFIFEDSNYDQKGAIAAFRKLTTVDGAKVIYNFGGPTTAALVPLSDRGDVVLFSSETEPKFSVGHSNSIRFNNSSQRLADVLVKNFVSSGQRRLGLISVDNEFVNGLERAIRDALPGGFSIEVLGRLQPNDVNIGTLLTRVKGRKFDGLIIGLFNDTVPIFFRELQLRSIKLPVTSLVFFDNEQVVSASGAGIIGTRSVSTEVSKTFQERYRSLHGGLDQISWAGFGYDFAKLAIEHLCPVYDSGVNAIKVAVRGAKFEGANGSISYVETTEGDKFFEFPLILTTVGG